MPRAGVGGSAPGRILLTRPEPPDRWLILADDLTGAADSAVAFARRGLSASVAWGDDPPGDAVLALDANSRRLSPDAAAACHRALLQAHHREGAALFKKIDSTLRGQPAAELAATVQYLRARGRGALAIVAPAFPAAGPRCIGAEGAGDVGIAAAIDANEGGGHALRQERQHQPRRGVARRQRVAHMGVRIDEARRDD